MPGHAICNVGDALAILSGGILRSNMDRVLYVIRMASYDGDTDGELIRPPLGGQSEYERWSLVYFTRPGNSVLLNPLVKRALSC